MQNLPDKLYTVNSVVQIEQIVINQYGIPAYELMKRAGKAVFEIISTNYSDCKNILIVCGAGNNAGDGYVVARLAQQSGFNVQVFSLIDPALLKAEALSAYKEWISEGSNALLITNVDSVLLDNTDLVIDALLGTGLAREVKAEWAQCINAINDMSVPVISVDIPSGLLADTGVISGVAIKADVTVSFIGLKQGLFTAQAKDVCGEIMFHDLGLPDNVYRAVSNSAKLIDDLITTLLPKRMESSHKGKFGHALIVGGNTGMPGAVILAARAALRTGAGLVTIVTVPLHLEAICSAVPEAMVRVCDTEAIDDVFSNDFINSVTHVAVGMGLGQDTWSLVVLKKCIKLNKPMLIDADALNLIAKQGIQYFEFSKTSAIVITPHPGEASRLLTIDGGAVAVNIQEDRFNAIEKLHKLFNRINANTVVLKGSGTIIFDGEIMKICQKGSSAMAVPGMGDVLSGILVSLLAQDNAKTNSSISKNAELAVYLHALAADVASKNKTRGLLASDVIETLPELLQ